MTANVRCLLPQSLRSLKLIEVGLACIQCQGRHVKCDATTPYVIDANEMAKNVSTPSLEEEALIRLP